MDYKNILVSAILSALSGRFLFKYKVEGIKLFTSKLIIYAEDNFGKGKGAEKLDFVIFSLREALPSWVNWILSDAFLVNLVENALKGLQEHFKKNFKEKIQIIDEALSMPLDSTLTNSLLKLRDRIK